MKAVLGLRSWATGEKAGELVNGGLTKGDTLPVDGFWRARTVRGGLAAVS